MTLEVRTTPLPEFDLSLLERSADKARVGLLKAAATPFRADAAKADKPAAADKATEESTQEVEEAGGDEQQILGRWRAESGECEILFDVMCGRLSYEERLGEIKLQGWLNQYIEASDPLGPAWHADLHILEEDEDPWYGPGCGLEPEHAGDIQVRLHAGPPRSLETRIRHAGEEDWLPPTTWTLEESRPGKDKLFPGPALEEFPKSTQSGMFVFGAAKQ
mmetsp:Transcript_20178/g.36555  ORF Transcript_20178/g.36555 Transcript_20178/m.36555 type:complete len:219 (-) Transcript_20178:59-715(-)